MASRAFEATAAPFDRYIDTRTAVTVGHGTRGVERSDLGERAAVTGSAAALTGTKRLCNEILMAVNGP